MLLDNKTLEWKKGDVFLLRGRRLQGPLTGNQLQLCRNSSVCFHDNLLRFDSTNRKTWISCRMCLVCSVQIDWLCHPHPHVSFLTLCLFSPHQARWPGMGKPADEEWHGDVSACGTTACRRHPACCCRAILKAELLYTTASPSLFHHLWQCFKLIESP